MALTRKLTKSLTRPLTRKLTGDELQQLFLDLCKTFSFPLVHESDFSADTNGYSATEGTSMTIDTFTGNNDGIGGKTDVLRLTVDSSSGGRFHLKRGNLGTDTVTNYEVTFDYLTGGSGFNNRFWLLGAAFANTHGTESQENAKIIADSTWRSVTLKGNLPNSGELYIKATTNTHLIVGDATNANYGITGSSVAGQTIYFKNIKVKKENLPIAAFSLRKLGDVSPYACRIRRSSDNTEAQVMFDASDRVSESSVVRNTSQNILTASENFTAWDVTAVSRTLDSIITDPFGGSNAYKLNETAANSFHFISEVVTIPSGAYTFSCYMKAGERTTGSLMLTQSGNFGAVFDLSAGSVSSVNGTGNTASIEAVGTDGWYRCAIHNNGLANIEDFVRIAPQNGVLTSFTGDASKGIYIFGAMLEETTNYSLSKGTVLLSDTFSDYSTGWNFQAGDASITNGLLNFNVVNGGYVKVQKSLTYNQNRYYTLTAIVNGTAGKKMRFRDDAGDDGGLTDGNPTGAVDGRITMTGSPQEVSLTWMPTTDSTEIVIERDAGTGDWNFTVDNLVIKETTPIFQDDFNDNSNNWSVTPSNDDNGIANGVINQTVVTDYTKASIHPFSLWEAGCKYRLTADVNGTAGKSIRFRDDTSNGGGLTLVTGAVAFTGGPQKVVLDFIATAASDELAIERASNNQSYTIDNVKIEKFDVSPSEYISTPVVSNDGLTFTESTLDDFVGGENHLPKSQDFDDWTQVGGSQTIVENHTNHLDESTASLITTSATGARIEKTISIVQGQTYVASVWVKRYNSSRFEMYVLQGGPSYAPQGYIRANISSSDGSLSTHENHANTSEITYTDFGGGWYRASFKFTATSDDNSAVFRLRADIVDGDKGTYFFGAQLNKDSLKDYQKTETTARDGNAGIVVLYNQTGGEDAIQETPAEQPLLYKEGLLVRSGSSPAWYYRDKSSGNDDVLSIPSLAGISRLDAFFVHDSGSDTTFMYPTGTTGKWGMIATQFNATTNWQNYKADDSSLVFVNGTQGSPTDRGELYNLLNGRKLVHHQNGETTSWTAFNMAAYNQFGSNSLNPDDFKFSEWIFFDSNQSANRTSIEKDINDFHNIF